MKSTTCYFNLFPIFFCLQITLLACTCVEYNTPICAMISRSDAVFTGKVEKITPFSVNEKGAVSLGNVNSISTVGGDNLVWLHVKVDRKFKGIKDDFVKVLTYINTSCDLGVKKGERWIFYASHDNSGNFGVGACGGTSKISSDDKEYLEEVLSISQDKNIESINGFVKDDKYSLEGIKNTLITVEGKDFFSTTTTGEKGSFNIQVPQAGKYNVTITVPSASLLFNVPYSLESNLVKMSEPTETKSVLTYEVNIPQGQCHYSELEFIPIDLKATAEIKGKFVASDGKQFPKFYPQLCPLKETEKETLYSCKTNWELKPDGSFNFGRLREGKFVIVVNEKDFPEVSAPFLRHYYPGVKDFKDAQIINLEQGQKLDGLSFNLPPILPTREVKGRVFWKDKSPVTYTEDSPYDETPKISLYNPQKHSSSLNNHYFKFSDKEKDGIEEVKTVKVEPDGTFSVLVFDGFEYIIEAWVYDKREKYHCGLVKIMADDDLTALNIILNRKDCGEKYRQGLITK